MKRIALSLIIICIAVASSFAQQGQGGGRRGNGPEMRERMKQQLKEQMQLTDVQADSIVAFQQEMQTKSRELRQNTGLTDDQRRSKMQEFEAERNKKFKTVLPEEQVTKLLAYYEEMRKRREERRNAAAPNN